MEGGISFGIRWDRGNFAALVAEKIVANLPCCFKTEKEEEENREQESVLATFFTPTTRFDQLGQLSDNLAANVSPRGISRINQAFGEPKGLSALQFLNQTHPLPSAAY